MRSYFSRIARHSGIGASARRGTSAATRPDPQALSPIDHDEVVMVPTTQTPAVPGPRAERRTPEEGAAVPANDLQKTSHPEPVMNAEQNPTTSLWTADATTTEMASTRPSITPVAEDEAEVGQHRTAGEDPDAGDVSPSNTVVSIERSETRFVESEGRRPERSLDREPQEKAKPTTQFFSKTAEIIEGRSVEKSEAQTILLREIQEWVASAPDESPESFATLEENLESSETTMTEVAGPDQPEPGVVRIIGERRVQQSIEKQREVDVQPLETPVFELSIGTVNVVIEDDQPRPAAITSRPNQTTNTGSRPERSRPRLSRSYL